MSKKGADGVSKSGKKVRKLFSQQEDEMLTKIMYQQPFETWIAVAEQLPGRTARQCRDRWVNYLSPSNKNGPWSHEEDQLLAEKYVEHGPQWTTIAKFFDGRSENNVKNRWYTYVKARFNNSQGMLANQNKRVIPAKKQTPRHAIRTQTVQPAPIPAYRPGQIYPFKINMTPAPQAHIKFLQMQPVQEQQQVVPQKQKTPLPPITAFVNSIPATSAAATMPTTFYGMPRFRSESVRPYGVYQDF